eukprot:TRINITY_DN66816_c8_g16_i1.p1 TRINITY_DN66816_c8_g16~~TRINITY_DN66816_c8_g16_i1.p1  ORF type:complete len:506 (-),score=304.31 TRINITY_DN66816_c8_g16_i1:99-1616(-)
MMRRTALLLLATVALSLLVAAAVVPSARGDFIDEEDDYLVDPFEDEDEFDVGLKGDDDLPHASAAAAAASSSDDVVSASSSAVVDEEEEDDEDDDDDDDKLKLDDAVAGSMRDSAAVDPEELYDEDEFEGIQAAAAATKRSKRQGGGSVPPSPLDLAASKASQAKDGAAGATARAAELLKRDWSEYKYELVGVAFVIAYIINYFIGKRKNDAIAQTWFTTFQPVFEEQFERLGAYAGDQEGMILKESPSLYRFYASGRRYCTGMLATLDLVGRHDFFSMILGLLDMATTRDTITLEFPMDDACMENFVFAIMPKKHVKRLRRTLPDLTDFAVPIKSARLDPFYGILTDAPELESSLLDDSILRALGKHQKMFGLLHFSDDARLDYSPSRKVLRFTFLLPDDAQDYPRMLSLVRMAIHFVDRVATTRLSAKAIEASKRARRERTERERKAAHEARQERAARLREEKRRAAEEAAPKNLSKEAQRKREAQEYRRSLKKKKPRVKMIR